MFPIKNLIQNSNNNNKKNHNNNTNSSIIQKNLNLQNQNIYSSYRKTSAEIISEAKNMLAGGHGGGGGGGLGGGGFNGMNNGVTNNNSKNYPNPNNNTGNTMIGGARLVSTRRPITPREPKRQLYGKQAPPGRPPSSFSLRYLQFESRVLPSIEAIIQKTKSIKKNVHSRSGSLGLIDDNKKILDTSSLSPPSTSSSVSSADSAVSAASSSSVATSCSSSSTSSSSGYSATSLSVNNHHKLQGKLPALLIPPKLSGSLDNLSEEMPPRKDFKSKDGNHLIIENKNNHQTTNDKNILKIKNLSNNRKSFDNENMPPIEMKINKHHKLVENNRKQSINKTPIILSKTLLIKSNDLLIQSSTETLLDLLKAHAGIKECTEETILHINGILNELYTRVKGANGDWRSAVLGALYGLVECTSPKILLSVARVVLVLCVTGSNLTGACKLVFKIARNEVNDHLFIDSDVPELLIDGLGRANPLEEPEACIYGYGAVRFLANASSSSSSSSSSTCAVQKTTSIKTNKETSAVKTKCLAQRLARHGAIQLMILHLQMLNEAGATIKLVGPSLHALFQLSGALRALANIPLQQQNDYVVINQCPPPPSSSSSLYYSNNNLTTTKSTNNSTYPKITETFADNSYGGYQLDMAGSHLVRAAEICIGEAEVQANLIRTLSVLSENQLCCEVLSEYVARIGILLGPCTLNDRDDIPEKSLGVISRIGYILGNIMARFDTARLQFFTNDVAMEYLLDTLDKYAHKNIINNNTISNNNAINNNNNNKGNSNNNNNNNGGNDTTLIDVLIKLVRVIANMSVNPEVGYGLCTRQPLGGTLLTLMININNVKIDLSSEMEELLFATLGALHNLSFYQDTNQKDEQRIIVYSSGSMAERLNDLTESLCYTLMYGPKNAKSEVARVLGNMTRCPIVRQSLCSAGCLKVLVKNLESTDYELITTSCGVLVNLLGDWERRAPFREIKGPLLLRDVLQKSASHNDWLLAGIVCQVFWNYLIDSGNIIDALGEDEADYISGDLAEYLDEETIFNGEQPDSMWEQFAVIATDLLERIQSSITYYNNDSSNNPSDDDDNDDDKNGAGTDENGNKINNRRCWQGHFKQWLEE